ncbi:DUF222 domain-containing protein [Saccharomonospora sp. NPDC046836]|uniref:HNH endonuclease signature motif containing protein n=1 Tax=Saccharomonospora sp. NPDC046836 TaxID=3156921 RepID=UPI0033C2E7A5
MRESVISPMSLGDKELLDGLRGLEQGRRESYARELAFIAEIEARGLPAELNCSGVGALIREMFNLNPIDARRMVAHARALLPSVTPSGAPVAADLPVVADTLQSGKIGPEHVEAIHKAIYQLPLDTTDDDRAAAEKILCEAATVSEPRIIARLGREIRERLDPDGAEPKDDTLIRPKRWLDFRETANGVTGTFGLDKETGALLANLLSPLTAPRSSDDGPDLRSRDERYGDAFADILALAARCPDTPTEAGEPVTLLVSATLDQLTTGIGQGLVDGHLALSAGQIRRMACDAKAAPMVFGTASEVLDVGRTTRTVPRSLRRALIHRDKGCSFPGCDRKAKWSQAHHIVHWSNGGPTTLDNLTLVCQHHHRVVHHSNWEIRMINGIPWYIPPPHIDPEQEPRRNTFHAWPEPEHATSRDPVALAS